MIFKRKKYPAAAIIMALLAVFICGCDTQTAVVSDSSQTQELVPVISEVTEQEPQPYPVIVNDVVIEARPERVVSLSPSLTEILCELGYTDTIVGRGSYCDYPEQITGLTDAGRPAKPDYDTIISLSPDIVFTATSIPVKDVYRLEESGIKTIYISYPRNVDEFENIYKALGLIYEGLFDGEKKGIECFLPVRSALNSGISLGKFVYITEGLAVATGDTFESSVLSYFGINVGLEGSNYSFPKEYLLEMQPDVVLLSSDYTADDLKSDEIYSQLEAVMNGKIIYIDNSCFERPSARISVLIEQLREKSME